LIKKLEKRLTESDHTGKELRETVQQLENRLIQNEKSMATPGEEAGEKQVSLCLLSRWDET
jgi:hypothetical protein